MKQARNRSFMFLMTILTVLAMSAVQIVPVLADDEAPPPPAATEVIDPAAGGVVPPPEQNPSPEAPPAEVPTDVPVTEAVPAATQEPVSTEVAPAATKVPTDIPATDQGIVEGPAPAEQVPSDVLTQLPEGTEVVVLNENNEAVPLATQQAAEIITSGDPIWCPVGVTPKPGVGGCTNPGPGNVNYDPTKLSSLIAYLAILDPAANGVIWIEKTFDSSVSDPVAGWTLDGLAFSKMDNFSLTIKGGWNGPGTNTVNINEPSELNGRLNIINWNGNITLSDIEIVSATGGTALNITTTKGISLTRVKSHDNAGTGAMLSTTSGTGKVTITSSDFYQNGGAYGLFVQSAGAITLTNVTASQNTAANYGALLDNTISLLQPGITLNNSSFNGNWFGGLNVYSKGLIQVSNLTASGNGVSASSGGGALLSNTFGSTAGITLTGTNIFNDNYGTGLTAFSKGAIKLNNVIANANDGNGYGAHLSNSGSATAQPITLTGTNQFKYNKDAGLNIISKGLITLNNVNASGSLTGYGTYIDNCATIGATCTASASGGVKLTGTNIMNNNFYDGLNIHSVGTLTLNNLTANGNGTSGNMGYGANLNNEIAATPKAITLTGTNVFNGNYSVGLYLSSLGALTVSNLTANDNHSAGATLLNVASGAVGGVTLNGPSHFSGNYNTGLAVDSYGAITLSTVTATGNGTGGSGSGIYINNSGGSLKPVTLTGINVFSGNHDIGLFINSAGAIKLNSVTASDNTASYGVQILSIYNHVSLAAVTLTGANTFNNNGSTGLHISASGIITLSSLTAVANSNGGVDISNLNSLVPRNVSISGSSAFNYNNNGGLTIHTLGSITLSNLTAIGNTVGFGVSLNNSSGTLPRGVTLTGTNTFNSNLGSGLIIKSLGAITLSNLTANGNGSAVGNSGAWISNSGAGTPQFVKLTGTNTFNGNFSNGLYITSLGAITANNLTANNTKNGPGVNINNSGAGASGAVTLTGFTNTSENFNGGINILSLGKVSLTRVTADGNNSDGLNVSTTGNITLTCGSFTSNGGEGVQLITPLAVLTGVFASGNSASNYNIPGVYTTIRNCPLP